jgi:hypothetical protein
MSQPSRPSSIAAESTLHTGGSFSDSNLADELRRAVDDIENGDYIELTPGQIEHCIATGESPWRESRG